MGDSSRVNGPKTEHFFNGTAALLIRKSYGKDLLNGPCDSEAMNIRGALFVNEMMRSPFVNSHPLMLLFELEHSV